MFSFNDLKQAYGQADQNKCEQFTFMGHDFVTKFAYYLLMYIEAQLDKNGIGKYEKIFEFSDHTQEIFMVKPSLN